MADVLLINPKQYKREPEKNPKFPPINLLRLASTLIEDGFSVKIIDFRIENDYNDLERELKKKPLCAGLSVVTGSQIKYALEISRYVKGFNVPVVWGGKHPTADPYLTIKNRHIDIVVKGEGEYIFVELVKYLEKNKDLNKIKGIIFKKNTKIIETSNPPLPDLEKLPDIPYNLVNVNKYKGSLHIIPGPFKKILLSLDTSRGCPYKCTFCASDKSKHKWRGVSANKIINDIKNIVDKFKVKDFMFVDENFCGSHKRVKEFVYLIKKERLDITFYANTTVNYLSGLDIGFLKQLKEAGMSDQIICVESGSQRILDLINKPLRLESIPRVTNKLKRLDINHYYSFIIGFPYETMKDVKKTFLLAIKLLLQNKQIQASILKLAPMPGTKVLEDCIAKGLERPKKLQDWINTSTIWESPSPWIDKDILLFMKRYKYISILGLSESYHIPFRNLLVYSFANVLKYRIKKDFYRFNIEEKLYNSAKNLTNPKNLIEV